MAGVRANGWLRLAAAVALGGGGVMWAQEAGVGDGAKPADEPSGAAQVAGGEPGASVYYSGPGRFEIVVLNPKDAQRALELGRVVWGTLSGPLSLPAQGYPVPISVRLVPESKWTEAAPFNVTAEPPGLVIVRVRWSETLEPLVLRHALVQGLILRQAIAWHGATASATVPFWLEQACVNFSRTRERPALLDQFQQESSAVLTPPPLRALLLWKRGAVEARAWELASLWLMLQLQAESGGSGKWETWLRGVLGGAAPLDTLPRAYAGLWTDFPAMELWWQTSYHHQRRVRGTPLMTPEASRAWLADRSRWLAARDGVEVVLPLGELVGLRGEAWVKKEMGERMRQSGAVLGVIHPYYANAAISLGRIYEASLKSDVGGVKTAVSEFERDAVDGRELEDTVNEILNTAPRE